jgi:hypothetical protein
VQKKLGEKTDAKLGRTKERNNQRLSARYISGLQERVPNDEHFR